MSRAARLLLAAALLLAPAAALRSSAEEEESVPIQRYLESLRLGDYLKEVQLVYPPVREWPSYREPGGSITKFHVERAYAKYMPYEVDVIRLGMRWGRLVHLQIVYSDKYAREKPLEKLVVDLSLIYGEPIRRGMVYSWQDGRTLLRAFNEEMPSPDGRAIEMRTSLEIMDRDVRKRVD